MPIKVRREGTIFPDQKWKPKGRKKRRIPTSDEESVAGPWGLLGCPCDESKEC